ncbi:isochorismatase [Sulfolobus sp. A20]|uniref:cysteine hydrolase family protein n=2 Tax=Sulfolobaceae TaxID=118883 RepID=UPI000845F1E9|nr:isochorismatase family cysteine hydrolase [Sulfolobus sp. A20]TRM78224.1 cysteine hydrolase [Sulfolobus sp. B5]TRM78378.1 cysteine hydrolase [Sulfolobus sp. A20-N-F8]TRM85379.1 cysteine hydrolase [Sulfolobus sp. F3]TRM89086.1 cysteine hydrolase [Sulfolobus sp. C3]TRM94522.1 cysteine hydrolase [Sulfolobus sp. A20-N-G8]TRN02648.1 cysteine hydrolase [Sulfolobus sp. E1]TRN04176.1 cysteine hydrolase [Sulfolobus sp. F1]
MKIEVPNIPIEKEVTLNPMSTALIIVDMQNDFVRKNGKLSVPTAENTIPYIKNLIDKARSAGALVVYTQDWHMKDDPEFKIWGEHALAGTWGAEIVDELKPEKEDFIVKKYRYDAFFETSLDYILRVKNIKNTIITGTVANICVLHTAGSAALRWYNVIMPKDSISAITEFDYYATLRQVDFLYKGKITTSDSIKFER